MPGQRPFSRADLDDDIVPCRIDGFHQARKHPRVMQEMLAEALTRPMRARWQAWSPRSGCPGRPSRCRRARRSEEHTSELQSRLHLVCRLLLEKKKKDYLTAKALNSNEP